MGFREQSKHYLNYFFAQFATRALGFISIPILTRLLTPSDYGIVSVFITYSSIFATLFTLNTYVAVGRYYYEEKDDFKEFLGTTLLINVVLFFFSAALIIILKDKFQSWLNIDYNLLYLLFPVVGITILSSIFEQVFSPRRESKKIAIVNSLRAYIGFALTVVIILLLNEKKYLGQIYSLVLTGIVASIYFIIQLRPYVKITFRKDLMVYIFKYSIPLIPYFLSGIILEQFGRVMIADYTGFNDAGLFSFAYNVGALMAMVVIVTNQAWVPYYYEYMNGKNYEKHDREMNLILRATLVIAFALICFGYEIGYILAAKQFHEGLVMVPLIVLGFVFFQIFYIYARNFEFHRKTVYLSVTILLSGVAVIVLNMIFIPIYGYIAAAAAASASYLLMAFLAWLVNRLLKLRGYPVKKIFIPLFVFFAFTAVYYLLLTLPAYWMQLTLKIIAIGLIAIALFWQERHTVIQLSMELYSKTKK